VNHASLLDPSGRRLSEEAIREIVDRVARVARPERLILFARPQRAR
jgi:hypothetical protein